MKIKSIKLDNVDNRSRAITINTSGGKDIKTPNRSIVKSEINKIKGMRNRTDAPISPFEVVNEDFPWQIYQLDLDYGIKVRDNLLKVDGLKKKSLYVESGVNIPNKMLDDSESKNLLKFIYPKTTKGNVLEDKFKTMLMEIQVKSGVDVITIPEPVNGCSLDDFVKNIGICINFLEDVGCSKPVMPIIDTNSDNDCFEQKLDYLINQHLNNKKNFSLMGISCRVYSNNPNLHSLRNYSDRFEHFWIHGFGAYRNKAADTFYNPHAANIWGIDTVGITPQSGGNSNSKKSNNSSKPLLRVYTNDTWGIHKINEKCIHEYLCDCDGCSYFRRTSKDFQSALDVHELTKSHLEMVNSRTNIIEDDMVSLIKDKNELKRYYSNTVGEIALDSRFK